jgi:hypothetical protein
VSADFSPPTRAILLKEKKGQTSQLKNLENILPKTIKKILTNAARADHPCVHNLVRTPHDDGALF